MNQQEDVAGHGGSKFRNSQYIVPFSSACLEGRVSDLNHPCDANILNGLDCIEWVVLNTPPCTRRKMVLWERSVEWYWVGLFKLAPK